MYKLAAVEPMVNDGQAAWVTEEMSERCRLTCRGHRVEAYLRMARAWAVGIRRDDGVYQPSITIYY